jgi:anti-sigma regulatory factor (Ser/Thr protein kinase)
VAVVETQGTAIGAHEHAVQFYEHDSELVDVVGTYLATALHAGEVSIVIATWAHRRAFAAELEAGGFDLAETGVGGKVLWIDAASTLATLMANGQIDRTAFDDVIGGLVRKATACGRGVRAYGEMVALLWDEGNVLAAIELERLWNGLARELAFSLLCSYRAASVAGSEHADALRQVCCLHSSVRHRSPDRGPEFYRCPRTEVTATFAAEHEAPGRARRLVMARLRQWGHDDTLVQDAALISSELATNAVLHAGSTFSIAVRVEDSTLRIAVGDAHPLAAGNGEGLLPRRGHGLGLVDALSARWGVDCTSEGKVVWAELDV